MLTATKYLVLKTGKFYIQDLDNRSSKKQWEFFTVIMNMEVFSPLNLGRLYLKSLAWDSCYGKETLHVSHQRDYKAQFKVKKAKVQ